MKLYVYPGSHRCRVAEVAGRLCGVVYEAVTVDITAGEHYAPEFVAINENSAVPVLVDGEFVLTECHAIASYFAMRTLRFDLYPHDPQDRAEVLKWSSWTLAHFEPPFVRFMEEKVLHPKLHGTPPDEAVLARATKDFRRYAGILDRRLADRTWLLGSRLTLADVFVAPVLSLAGPLGLPLAEFPNIVAWFSRFQALDAWVDSEPAR